MKKTILALALLLPGIASADLCVNFYSAPSWFNPNATQSFTLSGNTIHEGNIKPLLQENRLYQDSQHIMTASFKIPAGAKTLQIKNESEERPLISVNGGGFSEFIGKKEIKPGDLITITGVKYHRIRSGNNSLEIFIRDENDNRINAEAAETLFKVAIKNTETKPVDLTGLEYGYELFTTETGYDLIKTMVNDRSELLKISRIPMTAINPASKNSDLEHLVYSFGLPIETPGYVEFLLPSYGNFEVYDEKDKKFKSAIEGKTRPDIIAIGFFAKESGIYPIRIYIENPREETQIKIRKPGEASFRAFEIEDTVIKAR